MVFTCVTNAGKLIWSVGNGISQSFHSPAQLNMPFHIDIFTVLLQNITGDTNNTYHSTVTATDVSLAYNEMIVSCSDEESKVSTKKNHNPIFWYVSSKLVLCNVYNRHFCRGLSFSSTKLVC